MVQILSAEQIRAWDQYTVQHEPISALDLMERAAQKCVSWIHQKGWHDKTFRIFCGKGNNGGDGLAISRLLLQEGYTVFVYILETGKSGSDDFQANLQRLRNLPLADLYFLQSPTFLPLIKSDEIIVDALFGTGLTRMLQGLSAQVVENINSAGATVVSIDLPSGLLIEESSAGHPVVKADYSLTFQCYKLGLLVQENAPLIGEVEVLDIGLHPGFLQQTSTFPHLLDERKVRNVFRPRNRFAHKGTFGHALLIGGSNGKIGAIVLATRACLQSGAGLTTALVPRCGYTVLQITAPEAMTLTDREENFLTTLPDVIERFDAIGIGPGMGVLPQTQKLLSLIIHEYRKPIVLDADALNCLAQNKDWLSQLPALSILTPHPKEFDRMFGEHASDFDRINTAQLKSMELGLVIILKGHHSFIATPEGQHFFNSTGNAGMAKGGSGDVLTGIMTSLLAQGYTATEAAQLGVYIHGWAGDIASGKFSKEAMLPSHLIDCLSDVFLLLN